MKETKKTIILCVAFFLSIALTASVGPVFAEDPVDGIGLFELDGNAISGVPTPPEDWNDLYPCVGNGCGHSNKYSGVVPDAGLASIFDGGKKDIQLIKDWSWRAGGGGGFPDKDDITNAYAAAYIRYDAQDDRDELIVYFGGDRFANNGDAFMGFWFFKDTVTAHEDGSFGGEHMTGDVLVIVNYPQASGAVPEIKVAVWNPAVKGNLDVIYDSTMTGDNPTCGTGTVEDVCAIANANDEASPWDYTPKSGSYKVFPPESFFEGGINITDLVGGDTCFATFMAETRSSKQFSATLKDFVLGAFPLCAVELTKSCSTGTYDPALGMIVAPYSVTVTNTGSATVTSITATDNACGYGTPVDFIFGPLAAGASATQNGECLIPPPDPGQTLGTVKNGVSAIATVNGNPIPVNLAETCIVDPAYPNLCFSQCDITTSPNIAAYKKCVTRLVADNGVKVRVKVAGWVKNTSADESQVPLGNVQVVDNMAGGPLMLYDAPPAQGGHELGTNILLQPGAQAWYETYYDPTGINTECPGVANFEDEVTAEGVDIFTGETVQDSAPANCNLCTNAEGGCEPLYPLE